MSGMTDADYLDAIANGRYQVIESAAHHKERLRHIAARLRGDGEQGQAVAYLMPSGELFTAEQMDQQRGQYGDTFGMLAMPLYARPPALTAPSALVVDGAMVERACRAVAAAGPGEERHYLVNRDTMRAALAAALSAPSEQVAASVPCAFRSLLAEARRQYCDSDAAGDVLAWLDERVLDVDHVASVAVPEGWRLVPVEASSEMLDAAIDAFVDFSGEDEVDAVWASMLAAAPRSSRHE